MTRQKTLFPTRPDLDAPPPVEPVSDEDKDRAEKMFVSGIMDANNDFEDLRMPGGPLVDRPGLLRELAGILESKGDSDARREQRELVEQERLGKMVAKLKAAEAKGRKNG
jgi:hypothetical protein